MEIEIVYENINYLLHYVYLFSCNYRLTRFTDCNMAN